MSGHDQKPSSLSITTRPETGRPGALAVATAPTFAIGSMLSFQLGTALSVPLLLAVGPSSTTWLRLAGASAVLWASTRPNLAAHTGRTLAAAGLLGVATCGMAVFYAEAIARVPLGMATAIQFAGPLAVAVTASRGLLDVAWAALAGVGVALLTLTAACRVVASAGPAISSLIGLLVLHQSLSGQKAAGTACVVTASLGTTLGRRSPP